MVHRLAAKLRSFLIHKIRPSLCNDCRVKMDRKFGLSHRVKHHVKHHASKAKHRLRAGIHHVKIRGKMRKVKVLGNGKWRFMKG